MSKSTYKVKAGYNIQHETKQRALTCLKEIIANKGIVGINSNSNIEIIKRILNEHDVKFYEACCNGHKSVYTEPAEIVFNSHVDVVPSDDEAFTPKIVGNRLYGRGSADALGCAVSMVLSFLELKTLGKNVSLMIVSDEEDGGLQGTKHLLDNEFVLNEVKYVIVGEPTENFGFSVREKGILRIRMDVFGEAGHPERPDTKNAIYTAIDVMNEIRNHPKLQLSDEFYEKKINLSPTIINGGTAQNIVPDKVSIKYDVRFAPGIFSEEIIEIFEGVKKKYACDYKILKKRDASFADTNNEYFKVLEKIAGNPEKVVTNGASDYSYFFEKGIPGVVYGVKGAGWHKNSEYVELDSVYKYIENLVNFVLEVD
ncbi:MAG: M20 family metallopeptidase [Candidatus Nanoarchaeia archaeon]